MALGNFFRLIEEGGPSLVPASKLLQVYAREQNRDLLRDFYYSDDRRVDSAALSLSEAATMSVSISAPKAILPIFMFVPRTHPRKYRRSKRHRNFSLRIRNGRSRQRCDLHGLESFHALFNNYME